MEPSVMTKIGTFLKDCWAYLAALVGIVSALYRYVIAPVLKKRRERQQKQEDILRELSESVKAMSKSVGELSTDVGFLQHDRLVQGHDHFMKLGYIPIHDQENLIKMYDRYISQERNSLFKSYRDDLLSLPSEKDTNWGAEKGA